MLTESQKYLLLQQLNDSLFPIGGYTQSYGLETYVQRGYVHNHESFYQYLVQTIQHSLLCNEFLAVKLAYQAAMNQQYDLILQLDQIVSASKPALEIRQASTKLGSRFIKTVESLGIAFSNDSLTQYYQQIKSKKAAGHHSLAYGVVCGALNLPYQNSLFNFAYSQVASSITNGVKLIPLSQTIGQKLLYDLQHEIINALDKLGHLDINDLGRAAVGFELRCMQHEKLYSRLYMS